MEFSLLCLTNEEDNLLNGSRFERNVYVSDLNCLDQCIVGSCFLSLAMF